MKITEFLFKEATGEEPKDDDLERCNCQLAGQPGHWYCGWNKEKNKPVFFGDVDHSKIPEGYYKVNFQD